MTRSKFLLGRFKRYMTEKDWAMLKKGISLYVLAGVLVGLALTMMMPSAVALETGGKAWGLEFWPWILVLAIIALLASTSSFFGTSISYEAGLGFMNKMQQMVGNKVARLPLGDFRADSAGKLSRMVNQEMLSLGQMVAYFLGQLIKNVASALVFCLGAWLWDWHLGLMLTLAIPGLFIFLRLGQACIGKEGRLEDPAEKALASRIVEFAKCQPALRACNTGSEYEELQESFERSRKQSTMGLVWGTIGNFISGTGIQTLFIIMIMLVGQFAINGRLEPLQTLIMIGIGLRFMVILIDISGQMFALEERRQMMNSLDDLLEEDELPVVDQSKGQPADSSVEVDKLCFSYDSSKRVLSDISFKVEDREMLAIVGPSGSGKTTIIKLIARFYDPDSGSIKLGGVDLRELTTEDLFENISFVFQDVYLFNDSLRNNILMARPDASQGDLEAVASLAGVKEIVDRLPEGWDSICGEGGRALSGGERQRVSIARALLKQAPIVLFDEATSALDAENEKNIVASMQEIRKKSTLIVVAHKLETIQMADRIVVLDEEGRIAEMGKHQDLIDANGAYKKFWDKRAISTKWKLV